MRFDDCADSYDANAGPQRVFAERVAGFCRVKAGEQVLELGAGTGALTRCLCTAGARVRATDVSPAMVSRGRAAVPQASWSELDAFGGRLPLASLQVSSGLLQWAAEPVIVLCGWGKSLEPGAKMVHAFPCEPCLGEWRSLVRESPVYWRDEAGWREVFEKAGLSVMRTQVWREQPVFSSALDLARSLHQSGVTGRARLGAGQLREALRIYDERFKVAQGVIATWVWMAVEASSP